MHLFASWMGQKLSYFVRHRSTCWGRDEEQGWPCVMTQGVTQLFLTKGGMLSAWAKQHEATVLYLNLIEVNLFNMKHHCYYVWTRLRVKIDHWKVPVTGLHISSRCGVLYLRLSQFSWPVQCLLAGPREHCLYIISTSQMPPLFPWKLKIHTALGPVAEVLMGGLKPTGDIKVRNQLAVSVNLSWSTTSSVLW